MGGGATTYHAPLGGSNVAKRVERLGATVSDARVLYRIWGILPILKWVSADYVLFFLKKRKRRKEEQLTNICLEVMNQVRLSNRFLRLTLLPAFSSPFDLR